MWYTVNAKDKRRATGHVGPPPAPTAAGGKRLRARLVRHFGQLCGADAQVVEDYAMAVEFLHAATLVHDDILDGADKRRGQPTANAKWGNAISETAVGAVVSAIQRFQSAVSLLTPTKPRFKPPGAGYGGAAIDE